MLLFAVSSKINENSFLSSFLDFFLLLLPRLPLIFTSLQKIVSALHSVLQFLNDIHVLNFLPDLHLPFREFPSFVFLPPLFFWISSTLHHLHSFSSSVLWDFFRISLALSRAGALFPRGCSAFLPNSSSPPSFSQSLKYFLKLAEHCIVRRAIFKCRHLQKLLIFYRAHAFNFFRKLSAPAKVEGLPSVLFLVTFIKAALLGELKWCLWKVETGKWRSDPSSRGRSISGIVSSSCSPASFVTTLLSG